MNISAKFQLYPPYSFWGVDFWIFPPILPFGCHDNQSNLEVWAKSMFGRGRLKKTFLKNFRQNIRNEIAINASFHFFHYKHTCEPALIVRETPWNEPKNFFYNILLFTKISKPPSSELRIFLYILYIFDKPPWNERKISLMPFWNLSHVCISVWKFKAAIATKVLKQRQ